MNRPRSLLARAIGDLGRKVPRLGWRPVQKNAALQRAARLSWGMKWIPPSVAAAVSVLLVSGCATYVSIKADAQPVLAPAQLSQKLAPHYAALGLRDEVGSVSMVDAYPLGVWTSPRHGFVGHAAQAGVLAIRIVPKGETREAAAFVAQIQTLVSKEAPLARIEVEQSTGPDVR